MSAASPPTVQEQGSVSASERDPGISFLATDVSRLMTAEFTRLVKPLGLTTSQVRLISQLYHQDGLTQTELAFRLATHKVAITELIDRLEAGQWIERRVNPADQRSNLIYLSDRAHQVDDQIMQASRDLHKRALAGLSRTEISALQKTLRAVRANLVASTKQ